MVHTHVPHGGDDGHVPPRHARLRSDRHRPTPRKKEERAKPEHTSPGHSAAKHVRIRKGPTRSTKHETRNTTRRHFADQSAKRRRSQRECDSDRTYLSRANPGKQHRDDEQALRRGALSATVDSHPHPIAHTSKPEWMTFGTSGPS
ncbi:hypothetical protein AcV7_002044 [Taiwanofungus camphoratus]|nr:hypothetical protein AcV7_002044 [Antrodia cinnamomea]